MNIISEYIEAKKAIHEYPFILIMFDVLEVDFVTNKNNRITTMYYKEYMEKLERCAKYLDEAKEKLAEYNKWLEKYDLCIQ